MRRRFCAHVNGFPSSLNCGAGPMKALKSLKCVVLQRIEAPSALRVPAPISASISQAWAVPGGHDPSDGIVSETGCVTARQSAVIGHREKAMAVLFHVAQTIGRVGSLASSLAPDAVSCSSAADARPEISSGAPLLSRKETLKVPVAMVAAGVPTHNTCAHDKQRHTGRHCLRSQHCTDGTVLVAPGIAAPAQACGPVSFHFTVWTVVANASVVYAAPDGCSAGNCTAPPCSESALVAVPAAGGGAILYAAS